MSDTIWTVTGVTSVRTGVYKIVLAATDGLEATVMVPGSDIQAYFPGNQGVLRFFNPMAAAVKETDTNKPKRTRILKDLLGADDKPIINTSTKMPYKVQTIYKMTDAKAILEAAKTHKGIKDPETAKRIKGYADGSLKSPAGGRKKTAA